MGGRSVFFFFNSWPTSSSNYSQNNVYFRTRNVHHLLLFVKLVCWLDLFLQRQIVERKRQVFIHVTLCEERVTWLQSMRPNKKQYTWLTDNFTNKQLIISLTPCVPVWVLKISAGKMSSRTPNKSLKRPATSSIIGYVHHLSPEKGNKKNTSTLDYASFTLQTSGNETKEALTYSKHKRQLFSQSQTNRTLIKLTDFTFTEKREFGQRHDIRLGTTTFRIRVPVFGNQNGGRRPVVRSGNPQQQERVGQSSGSWKDCKCHRTDQSWQNPAHFHNCDNRRPDIITIDLWETHINDVIEGHSYQWVLCKCASGPVERNLQQHWRPKLKQSTMKNSQNLKSPKPRYQRRRPLWQKSIKILCKMSTKEKLLLL